MAKMYDNEIMFAYAVLRIVVEKSNLFGLQRLNNEG